MFALISDLMNRIRVVMMMIMTMMTQPVIGTDTGTNILTLNTVTVTDVCADTGC